MIMKTDKFYHLGWRLEILSVKKSTEIASLNLVSERFFFSDVSFGLMKGQEVVNRSYVFG